MQTVDVTLKHVASNNKTFVVYYMVVAINNEGKNNKKLTSLDFTILHTMLSDQFAKDYKKRRVNTMGLRRKFSMILN